MPCDRCGARQTDPDRGPSRWRRAVRRGRQVLICPDCQDGGEEALQLDDCPACRSTRLVRVLGETTCRRCGAVVPGNPERDDGAGTGAQPVAGLAAEVDRALDQLFRR